MSSETVLVHFNKDLPIGIACDASNVWIGAVLFYRYKDGSERPIANVSKTLTDSQRDYKQIQKEALALIFGLKRFSEYLYGRSFILITDHRPLLAIFGQGKGTPVLAANRLARWALLNQFDYKIEYQQTLQHANADALSRFPTDTDAQIDREESQEDTEQSAQLRVSAIALHLRIISLFHKSRLRMCCFRKYCGLQWKDGHPPTQIKGKRCNVLDSLVIHYQFVTDVFYWDHV